MIIPEHPYTVRERTACEVLARLPHVATMLNVGMRNPDDSRNQWWLKICYANQATQHVLEVFEPNCRELRRFGIENVRQGDVRRVSRWYRKPFDVVLWWHGPEHVEKAEAVAAIAALWSLTRKALILGCPLGEEPQETCYGNIHERHVSTWKPEEFEALGATTVVVRDQQVVPHITVWRVREPL